MATCCFTPAGKPEPYRIHGAYVSEEETARGGEFLASQGGPRQHRRHSPPTRPLRARQEEGEADGEFDDALTSMRRAWCDASAGSTSLLQRRLKVGYFAPRAADDQLENLCVVGPFPRQQGPRLLVD